ncbi:MAG: rhodanese-like domain-containing protein [Haliscomenobacter sp.]|nr:rhodanese-like domain-containing protein [Haliscomenobacter sp.]MBK8656090.1 rhodanese-like domain-containing protein [Haliscomenobacter sp.]MBP9078238.1 rhodanese-like domain-containing protein [Haliscomenobacter sp.]
MDITVQELKSKMERGDRFVLIDVREPDEHQAFNVGGLLIPLGTVPRTIPELEEHQEEEVIIYCRSGRRSATAQYMLQQAGFQNVRNLEGGMLAWIELFGEK